MSPNIKLKECKIFNDSVHGSITMDSLCVAIIDTPQFQRLRFLKQTGSCCFVYPAAVHGRFEHCLGVSYLAGELATSLQLSQPELDITDTDILCVKVAGLCHDLGHGPFSHLWQNFVEIVKPDKRWTHEKASIEMLDYLLMKNKIKLVDYDLTEDDLHFIKELIAREQEPPNSVSWPYTGRGEEKSFLYDIVANQRNGVDVDKWEYFLRDSLNLGFKVTFTYQRLIQYSRAIPVEDDSGKSRLRLCLRDKEVDNVLDMFHARYVLHKKAYQHRTTQVIDEMLLDVFRAVDEHLTFQSSDGKQYHLSDAVDDMAVYCQLTDAIVQQVLHLESSHASVEKAQKILNDIFTRKLYYTVGSIRQNNTDRTYSEEDVKEAILTELNHTDHRVEHRVEEATSSLIVTMAKLNYGNGSGSPIENIRFYTKSKPNEPIKIDPADGLPMRPSRYESVVYRVLCRSDSEEVRGDLKEAFRRALPDLKMTEERVNRSQSPEPGMRRPSNNTTNSAVVGAEGKLMNGVMAHKEVVNGSRVVGAVNGIKNHVGKFQ